MADVQVRSDAVDVEQIMRQIRARIREKRGADYTEQEIRELASVKLEKFLDPRGVRSNLVQDFRRNRVITPAPQQIGIGDVDVFGSPRAALRALRKFLSPILRLFFSPTPLVHAVNSIQKQQNDVNAEFHRRFRQREEMDALYYEVIHNLVVELTRLSIENHNMKMRLESLSSRVDFDERRARALETVVQYKPAPRAERGSVPAPGPVPVPGSGAGPATQGAVQGAAAGGESGAGGSVSVAGNAGGSGDGQQGERGERRRRRRRRRRPGQNMSQQPHGGSPSGGPQNGGAPGVPQAAGTDAAEPSHSDEDFDADGDDGGDDSGADE